MENQNSSPKIFGLVGRNISYSFSKNYFSERFRKENRADCSYENFDIETLSEFPNLIQNHPNLAGLNVTIPYKESVIPYLDKLSKKARKIGAVNTIRLTRKGKLKGYNTDFFGFTKALQPLLTPHHKKALILGTGGASKAVAFALEKLAIEYVFVSRKPTEIAISYEQIDATVFEDFQIIINCTPLGTSPNTAEFPPIPYDFFSPEHIAFDLIYNPEETLFLKRAKEQGAVTQNGLEMLIFQAEKAWEIWNQ